MCKDSAREELSKLAVPTPEHRASYLPTPHLVASSEQGIEDINRRAVFTHSWPSLWVQQRDLLHSVFSLVRLSAVVISKLTQGLTPGKELSFTLWRGSGVRRVLVWCMRLGARLPSWNAGGRGLSRVKLVC